MVYGGIFQMHVAYRQLTSQLSGPGMLGEQLAKLYDLDY